jgi:hypothetical protein
MRFFLATRYIYKCLAKSEDGNHLETNSKEEGQNQTDQ